MPQPDDDPYAPPSAPIGVADESPRAEHLDGPPLLTIWSRPRSTIRTIVDTEPTRGVIALASVSGFGGALGQLLQGKPAEELTLGASLGLSAFIGPLAGIIYLYIAAAVVRMTGGWLGGRATAEEVRAALAWGSVPNLVSMVMIIGSLLAIGPNFFRPEPGAPPDQALALVLGVSLSINIWGMIVTLKCLGEVQRFSALAAFASALLALLIVLAVLVALGLIALAFGGLRIGG